MKKLNERRIKILKAIVQSYIDCNTPIGSVLLTKRYAMGLSSATVRNIMAKLEEAGYISQPHTSAGRVPTEKGYRFYVDNLLEEQSLTLSSDLCRELSNKLRNHEKDNTALIDEAAKTLSSVSHYLAIATPPKVEDILLKRIKFIKYENRQVLTILISDEGIVENKIIELDRVYSQAQLDEAAMYISSKYIGLTLKEVRERISHQLSKEQTLYNKLTENLLYVFKNIIPLETEGMALNGLSGTSYLTDFASMKQIKGILRAIEDKKFMLRLLQQISDSKGTQVIVGMDKIIPAMNELSMVVSTFSNKSLVSGAIGIIGPTRMNYMKMIPIVDHTAKALTKLLSEF
jgi:heat-inducible transcriptional repressor